MVSAPRHNVVYSFDALNATRLHKYKTYDRQLGTFGFGSPGIVILESKNVVIFGHKYENRGAVAGDYRFAGAVYIFDLGTGAQIRKIMPAETTLEYDMYFGASLLVSGDFLLVGAPGADSGNGRVYVFDINANWTEIRSFGPCDNQVGTNFGDSMAMSSSRFIITASKHSSDQMDNGAVYVGDMTAGVNYSKYIHICSYFNFVLK